MEIRAKSKFDFETSKALAHLSFYKKNNPKTTMITRVLLNVFFFVIVGIQYIVLDFSKVMLVLAFCFIFIALIDAFGYFILPKIQHKSLSKMQDTENEYIFYDNYIKEFSKSREYTAEADIEYSLFVKVYETSKYFFLFQTQNQAYIIDKSTIEGGTAEDIKNKLLSFVGDKYIVCKY